MSTSAIERVTAMVHLMDDLAGRIAATETALDVLRADYLRVEREDLPELMRELGLSEMTLTNGLKVTVTEEVTASITEERRAAAHEWLRTHNFAGIIKVLVTVPFGRGEEAEAAELAAQIRAEHEGHEVNLSETVHPQTLKAFVKEQVQDGRPLPFDLFGVHPYSRAKVVAPRSKR